MEQVHHLTRWVYVCANLICSKTASIMPNLAYVVDTPKPGVTVKAGRRGLLNLMDRGFGGSTDVGGSYDYWLKSVVNGAAYDYSHDWREVAKQPYRATSFHPMGPAPGGAEFGFSDGGHSWLTMGEYRSKSLSVVKPHEDLEPLENDHPLRRLIENPNPVDTHYDIEYEKRMFRLLCGVSFEWVPKNDWGVPAERWCIPSHWVWPRTGGGAYVSPDMLQLNPHADELIQYYEIRPWGGMGSAGVLRFPADEVIMELDKSPVNKLDGYSPMAAMAQWIDLDESISKSRWAQMMNQARPELWIELGPGYEDPTDDRIARIEAKLASRFQGEYNYAKPIVTPPGAKLTPLSYSPDKMAYGDGSDQTRDMILSGFCVPPAAVGLSKDMTYGSILATLGALCLDEQTECLTSDGWKTYDQIGLETRIACYDEDTNSLVYSCPNNIICTDYTGPMHYWEGERIDAAMTPGHRVYVRRCSSRPHVDAAIPWRIMRIDDMTRTTNYQILRTAPYLGGDAPDPIRVPHYDGYRQKDRSDDRIISPEVWASFIGTWVSEGHISRGRPEDKGSWRIGITQHPCGPRLLDPDAGRARFAKMREGVMATPFEWSERMSNDCVVWSTSDRGLYGYLEENCGKGAMNKKLPGYVKSWPEPVLRVLLDALIAGDGTIPYTDEATGIWNAQYATSSEQLADDVMEIAVKCGLAASIYTWADDREEFLGRPRYRVNMSDRLAVGVGPANRSVKEYSGKIWCVEVPTGMFVVRRNGKAHVTGNCAFCINPKLASSGQTQTKHLASRFDERSPAFSTRSGAGGRAGKRRCKLFYDDCLDPETECLTAEGWVKPDELTESTRIACYDDTTNTLVYRTPTRIVRRHHEGELCVWEGGRVNAAMTPRHRIYTLPRQAKKPEWTFKLAGELNPSWDYKVKLAAPAACDTPTAVNVRHYGGFHQQYYQKDDTIDPRLWLEFLGYYISEGWVGRVGNRSRVDQGAWNVVISQATDNTDFHLMEKCIGLLPGHWKRRDSTDKRHPGKVYVQFTCTDRGMYEHLLLHCGKGSANKKIPDYVKAWPAEDLRVLLDALIAGDGRKPTVNTNTGVWNSQYTTVSKQLADDVMEIAVKCGLAASIRKCKKGKEHHTQPYVVNLSSRNWASVLPTYRKTIPYSGPVWCVEVPTGKFVVRRNGMAHITGNCVPADPQQVNSDIQADLVGYAITPNEIRALRGRKPYKQGGDDPMGPGPGGTVPIPLNTGDSLEALAQQLAPMAEMGKEEEQGPAEGAEGQSGDVPEAAAGPVNRLPSAAEGEAPETDFGGAGIAEPNSPPTKYWANGRSRDKQLVW